MLEILTKSSIRRKIFVLFVYNQGKEFYLSEIARIIGTTAGTARRELNKLLKIDFLKLKRKGNLCLYFVNPSYSLLPEIESIVRKTAGIEEELKNELKKIKNVSFAFIYGSYAKGNWRSDSDIDLFIVGQPEEDDVYRAVRRVEEIAGREINFHIAGETEFVEKFKSRFFIREISENPLMLIGNVDELGKLAR